MGLWDAVRDWLGKPRHENIASSLAFMQINIPHLERLLDLKNLAMKNGGERLPPTNSAGLDAVEQAVVAKIDQHRDADLNKYLDLRRTYDNRAQALGLARKSAIIDTEARAAKARMAECLHIGLDLMDERADDLKAAKTEYLEFRQKHGLRRPSRHPAGHKRGTGLLLILLVLEAVVNTKFFAAGDEFGLLGGLVQATVAAAFNLAIGFMFGLVFLPQMTHRSSWRRLVGVLAVPAYAVVGVGFCLAVAHYRDALGGPDPAIAASVGKASLLADPLDLADLNSWFLVVISVLFSLIAAADGWKWDDCYPGYGAVARRRESAKSDYVDGKDALMGELAEVRDKAIEQMRDTTTDIQANIEQHREIIENRRALRGVFLSHLDHLESAGNALLQGYRQENERARPADNPAPASFGRPWVMTRPSLHEDDGSESFLVSPETIRATLARIPILIDEILAAFESQMQRYKLMADQKGIDDDAE